MKIVTAAEMREIDRVTSDKYRVASPALMENAGAAIADFVVRHSFAAQKVTVFCGKGNNGGDGFVAARRLHERGKTVQVILLADPAELKGDAASMYRQLPMQAVVALSKEDLNSDRVRAAMAADVYVDAILGTGFKPPVTGVYAEAIEIINACDIPTLAVDIPSGADADAMGPQQGTIARSNAIVTFTAPRPAHVFSFLTQGITTVAGIGSPKEAIVSSLRLNVSIPKDFAAFVAPRKPDSNKGSYGHVLVIGGSLGKAGAAAMAGMSALRIGAGLSTVATPKSVLPTVAGFYPELMTEPLPETDAGTIATSAGVRIEELLKSISVVAIGPGISRDPQTATFVRALVANHTVPMVVDADGLNAFEGQVDALNGSGRTLIITPHPGEMARLAGRSTADVQKDRLGVARQFARDHELIVVLKGHRTLIVQPDGEAWVNVTGNPGLAKGGTGDILTGMVAGMLAQHPDQPCLAAAAAVYLHGLAADNLRTYLGEHAMTATDLLQGFAYAYRQTEAAGKEKSPSWTGSQLMFMRPRLAEVSSPHNPSHK